MTRYYVYGIIGLVLGGALLTNSGITFIDAGHRGVRVTAGKVDQGLISEGVQFYTPFISKIVEMDIRTQLATLETEAYTKDVQVSHVVINLNYNLDPEYVNHMFQNVGTGYKETILAPAVMGTVKDIIGKWNASELVGGRDKAAQDIYTQLKAHLAPLHINLTDVQISNIKYSTDFEQAIEEKVKAEQQALTAKNKTVSVTEVAKQKLISAEAEAKSMQIRAEALVKNPALIMYEAVQKWDGTLPKMMLGGNTSTLLNLDQSLND